MLATLSKRGSVKFIRSVYNIRYNDHNTHSRLFRFPSDNGTSFLDWAFSDEDAYVMGCIFQALSSVNGLDLSNNSSANRVNLNGLMTVFATAKNLEHLTFSNSKLGHWKADKTRALSRGLEGAPNLIRLGLAQCELEKWDEETLTALAQGFALSNVARVNITGNKFATWNESQLRGLNALLKTSNVIDFYGIEEIIEEASAAYETLLEKKDQSVNSETLLHTLAEFLEIIRQWHQFRNSSILRKLATVTPEINKLYSEYLDQTYHEVYAKTNSSRIALLKAMKYCMDASNEYITFSTHTQRQLDVYLQTTLGIRIRPDEANTLTASRRAVLWQYFALQQLLEIAVESSNVALQRQLQSTLPPVENAASWDASVCFAIEQLWHNFTALNIKQKYFARCWNYAEHTVKLAENEKSFSAMIVTNENAIAVFLQALPLCVDKNNKLLTYSPAHQMKFDHLLGMTCGIDVNNHLNDTERLALLRFLILRTWNTGDEKASRQTATFFKAANTTVLPVIKTLRDLDAEIINRLAAQEREFRKESASIDMREMGGWQLVLDCVTRMSSEINNQVSRPWLQNKK